MLLTKAIACGLLCDLIGLAESNLSSAHIAVPLINLSVSYWLLPQLTHNPHKLKR